MYYIDSNTAAVRAFDFEMETGAISNGRIINQVKHFSPALFRIKQSATEQYQNQSGGADLLNPAETTTD